MTYNYLQRPRWTPPDSVDELLDRLIPIVRHVATYGIEELTSELFIAVDAVTRRIDVIMAGAGLLPLADRLRRGFGFDLDAEEMRCAIVGDDSEAECDSFGRKFLDRSDERPWRAVLRDVAAEMKREADAHDRAGLVGPEPGDPPVRGVRGWAVELRRRADEGTALERPGHPAVRRRGSH